MTKGIDVSENNGYIPQETWDRLAAAGIKFVYVRSSYGRSGIDSCFLHNVNAAHNAGMKVGAYHYSYALNREEAVQEALHCHKVIEDAGVLLELPVFYDMEDADGYKARHGFAFDPEEITDMCRLFGIHLKLNWGVYASLSWLETYIDWKSLGCPVWNAQWSSRDDLMGFVWQYTDNFQFDDFTFDGNKMYMDW